MRILICGSRKWKDGQFIRQKLAQALIRSAFFVDSVVIHGGAAGADTLGGEAARFLMVDRIEVFKPNWNKYGKSAGFKRNQQMLTEGKPDLVLAFQLNNSSGTQDMIDRAQKAGVPVQKFTEKDLK